MRLSKIKLKGEELEDSKINLDCYADRLEMYVHNAYCYLIVAALQMFGHAKMLKREHLSCMINVTLVVR